MSVQSQAPRLAEAAAEFDRHVHHGQALQVVNELANELSLLRESFFERMHYDAEQALGSDSMLLGASALKGKANANMEIELYEIVESAAEVHGGQYVGPDDAWFRDWLCGLRLGSAVTAPAVAQRFSFYSGKSLDQRRRTFSVLLQKVFPESGHAPLVMYRLFPLAVAAATAIAFGDVCRAAEMRKQQISWLPGIADCHACHGGLLDNGDTCLQCGNPFWKYEWLTAECFE